MNKDMFTQMNDDLGQLLQTTGKMAHGSQDRSELTKKLVRQMDKLLRDAEAIGGNLPHEVRAIRSELDAYLQKPSEPVRIKVMKHAMDIKNKMREL